MKKMNNKGFSLVELIIVIAIMAILIVVLAPQYLKYVERSRNSTDMQNATTIVDAIQIWAADPAATTNPVTAADNGAVIKVTGTGTTTAAGAGGSKAGIDQAISEAHITLADIKCASRTAWDEYTITVTVTSTGDVSFAYGSSLAGTANTAFADRMAGK